MSAKEKLFNKKLNQKTEAEIKKMPSRFFSLHDIDNYIREKEMMLGLSSLPDDIDFEKKEKFQIYAEIGNEIRLNGSVVAEPSQEEVFEYSKFLMVFCPGVYDEKQAMKESRRALDRKEAIIEVLAALNVLDWLKEKKKEYLRGLNEERQERWKQQNPKLAKEMEEIEQVNILNNIVVNNVNSFTEECEKELEPVKENIIEQKIILQKHITTWKIIVANPSHPIPSKPPKYVIKPQEQQIIDWLIIKLESIENQEKIVEQKKGKSKIETSVKHKSIKQICSYKWQRNSEKELPELYKRMKVKFITEGKDENDFIKIFSGVPITEIKNPIRLKKEMSNRLLAYFLFQLDYLLYIEKCNWQSIAGKGTFFKNDKGKFITAKDLSVAKSERDYKFDKQKPKGYKEIDLILKEIKSISNISSY